MKTINFLKKTAVLMWISILSFSCNKDESLPKPQTGFFVKSINITKLGDAYAKVSFKYDSRNKLIQQTLDSEKLIYTYNDQGQLINFRVNNDESYRFEYTNDIITKIWELNPHTDEILNERSVTFSQGTYSVNGKAVCKVDDQNQLLELLPVNVVFLYGERAGVHPHLTLSPARYLILESDLIGFDLTLSNQELLGWQQGDGNTTIENHRDERGLITSIIAHTPFDKEYQWDIEYEERELVH